MKTASCWFWAIVLAQAVFLLAWAGWHEQVRTHAPVVRLKTRPVDPQDLLRGDYMILRYDISEPAALPRGNAKPAPGTDYWVVLEPRGDYHEAVMASPSKPVLTAGQIAVLGQTTSREGEVVYGIEQFFVPEGKGTPRFKTIEVDASVSSTHRLYIRRVLLDGKSYP